MTIDDGAVTIDSNGGGWGRMDLIRQGLPLSRIDNDNSFREGSCGGTMATTLYLDFYDILGIFNLFFGCCCDFRVYVVDLQF